MSLRLKVEFEGHFLTDPIKGGDYEVEDLDKADGFAVAYDHARSPCLLPLSPFFDWGFRAINLLL